MLSCLTHRFSFYATRYLSPERHFWEWLGFTVLGILVLTFLGPKIPSKSALSLARIDNTLSPRKWMAISTLVFYPFVSYTKLSWPGSNYPWRWLLFVGMPVGTLWLLSILFCLSSFSVSGKHGRDRNQKQLYKIRFWLLEIWFSFLPLVVHLLPGLFQAMLYSIWNFSHGDIVSSGQDGDNATIAYFCHGMYLSIVPFYYVWIGELSFHTEQLRVETRTVILWKLSMDSALRQVVGAAVCVLYYMGILTPISIVAGLNVNFLLWGGWGPNFRLWNVTKWFCHGWAIRIILGFVNVIRTRHRTKRREKDSILPYRKNRISI